MAQAKLTIGELEAGYPLYCKALRRLLKEEKSKRLKGPCAGDTLRR